jgi:acyl carrier protein
MTQITEVTEATEVTESGAPDRKAEALKLIMAALETGTPEQKRQIQRSLGVGGVVDQPRKKKGSNTQSRNHVLAYGQVQHPDNPDGTPWYPEPSEALVGNLGEEKARAVARNSYLKNQNRDGATTTMTAREAEQRFGLDSLDPDDLAMIAQEEFEINPEALADVGYVGTESSFGATE